MLFKNTNGLVYNPDMNSITIEYTTIGPDGEPVVKWMPVTLNPLVLSPCVGGCCQSLCLGAGEP